MTTWANPKNHRAVKSGGGLRDYVVAGLARTDILPIHHVLIHERHRHPVALRLL
ncbi:hypothetical protein CCICO_07485 [Corynebacterium ciconiae DSM 44920]|nr:hypothetical protein CCICO_07485 [Corynebacterium ciconiae DSM 44920]